MKVPLTWLKEYVTFSMHHTDLAHRLTMAGNEVGSIDVVGEFWDHVYVGYVDSIQPHPNADRLRLATVDLSNEKITVVCGAPNIQAGQKIAFAKVGASLFDARDGTQQVLKSARIRGIDSEGMVCSALELGLGDDHSGILVLPEDSPTGLPLAEMLGDVIFDLELTPNRPDCFSVLGIAREVAALTKVEVNEPIIHSHEETNQASISVEVTNSSLCSRYTASVIEGVRVAPSPHWLQDRLIKAGQRPINNVVDVTNYVMLEYGQPLHAFDLSNLRGGKVIVRPAEDGEQFETLDGTNHSLRSPMLVIADAERAIALAGVMGGMNTEMQESTTNILIESANFDPINTRKTSQALRIRTEASLRFEKGLQPELAPIALRRAIDLIIQCAGGKLKGGILDIYPEPQDRPSLVFSMDRLHKVLGMDVSKNQADSILSGLGFELNWIDDIETTVTIPYWRSDISQQDDLIEEIARIIGYDEIPTTNLSTAIPSYRSQPARELREEVRDALVKCGMQETISYPLTTLSSLEMTSNMEGHAEPLKVVHPMSNELEYLRTSLRGSLISTLAANQRHDEFGFRIFEVGRVYIPRESDLPIEKEMAVGLVSGLRVSGDWLSSAETFDFFDAKGILETFLDLINVQVDFESINEDIFVSGRSAQMLANGKSVGIIGEVDSKILDGFEIGLSPVTLFELDLDVLLEVVSERGMKYTPLSRYPGAYQDLSVVLDSSISASTVQSVIERRDIVVSSKLFDVYQGEGVPDGKKSLTYRVLFQLPDRTLTGDEVNSVRAEILSDLSEELGGYLRG